MFVSPELIGKTIRARELNGGWRVLAKGPEDQGDQMSYF